LVNIDNFPFLLNGIVFSGHTNLLTFCSLITSINSVSSLLIDDLLILVSEDSPPAGEFCIHISTSSDDVSVATIAIHLEDLVTTDSKSLCLAVELPFLSGLTISSLCKDVASNRLEVSLISLRDNEEVSVAVEAISWVVFTSLVELFILHVSHIPSVLLVTDNNVLFVLDSNPLSSFVLESITNVFEHLEPSSVCFPDLHVG